MKFEIFTVDTSDTSLESIGPALQDEIDKRCKFKNVYDVKITPVRANYSLPGESGSYRDYHYTESGFVVCLTYEDL